jgi:acyl carrier protein phosphodiesterase
MPKVCFFFLVIQEFALNNKEKKLKFSTLFQDHHEDIELYNSKLELEDASWKDLENHWTELASEFHVAHPTVKVLLSITSQN